MREFITKTTQKTNEQIQQTMRWEKIFSFAICLGLDLGLMKYLNKMKNLIVVILTFRSF